MSVDFSETAASRGTYQPLNQDTTDMQVRGAKGDFGNALLDLL